MKPWVGFDLDRTLAEYNKYSPTIGAPIKPMVDKLKSLLKQGKTVKIFTARVGGGPGRDTDAARKAVERWCETHIGRRLEVTCCKDWGMVYFYDDRAVQVEPNTGRIIGEDWEEENT